MATKAASSDNSQQKDCADSNGKKTNDDNKGENAQTTKTIVTNVDIGKTLADNSLNQSFWQPIFENQLKITSPNQIKYLGTKDFLSVKGYCRTNWEEKALEALLCGNKNKGEVTLDDWKERERSDQIRMNDRQECVNKTKLNLPKSEDWKTSSKNEDFNKKIDGIISKSTNQTINVLRQHLDEISVLKNASAGMAVSGILIKHADIENTNKVVIDIVGDICMKAPQKKQCEQVFDFSTKQKHDAYRQSMETFASSGNISVKAANSLDKRILYSYMTDKNEKSTLHVEQFFILESIMLLYLSLWNFDLWWSPEAGTFDEWKSRLTSENSTWNIIHRNEFIGVWEILSNHQTGFQDYFKLSKLMEVSHHIEYCLDTTSSEIQQCKFLSVICTFQDIIKIVCQDIGNMDYFIGMMNLKFIQDLFSHMIFITKSSTDEYFVSEVKVSMETMVKYMKNVDNPVKGALSLG
ncbi:unnamed protein product [Mytilus edulis]|uniref:Uncharacterized protein n=1 Tax=Mytilus edulis TaxID=6550 RepID=A0A8S3V198_MYTED|nr:unnamed protein product [Mytilus edulis]